MMRGTNTKAGLVASTLLALGACKAEREEPAPDDAQADAPRSIFKDEPNQADPLVSNAPLPPLRTILSFADSTTDLTQAVRAELETVAGSPQVEAGGRIVLRGHSDSAGSDEENLKSSRERAEAVRDFLTEAGIDADRIQIIAFGEQNPREPNALPDGTPNEAGRAANRRVHLTVQTGREAERKPTLIESLTESEDASEAAGAGMSTGPSNASSN